MEMKNFGTAYTIRLIKRFIEEKMMSSLKTVILNIFIRKLSLNLDLTPFLEKYKRGDIKDIRYAWSEPQIDNDPIEEVTNDNRSDGDDEDYLKTMRMKNKNHN